MSESELVNAYVEGQISRRLFVRRMVALGVSAGAAISYAHLLTDQAAASAPGDFYGDHYGCDFYETPPTATVKVKPQRKRSVVRNRKVKLAIKTSGNGSFELKVLVKHKGSFRQIGSRTIGSLGPGSFERPVGISPRGARIIDRKNRARLRVVAVFTDECDRTSRLVHTRTID